MDKRKLYETIMMNVAKEVKRALNESEELVEGEAAQDNSEEPELTKKEQKIVDYIMNGMNEAGNDSIILRLKYIAKRGLLTAGIVLAIMPKLNAQEAQEAKQIALDFNIEVTYDNYKNYKARSESSILDAAKRDIYAKAYSLLKIHPGFKVADITYYHTNKGTYVAEVIITNNPDIDQVRKEDTIDFTKVVAQKITKAGEWNKVIGVKFSNNEHVYTMADQNFEKALNYGKYILTIDKKYSEEELAKLFPAAYADKDAQPYVWEQHQKKYAGTINGVVRKQGVLAAQHRENPWNAIVKAFGPEIKTITVTYILVDGTQVNAI